LEKLVKLMPVLAEYFEEKFDAAINKYGAKLNEEAKNKLIALYHHPVSVGAVVSVTFLIWQRCCCCC
jgi:hypothetical protein